MAAPVTEKFEEMVLEISDDGTNWDCICGLVGVTITRNAQTDTTEVSADCDDESLPMMIEKSVRSIDVSVSADGVWAQTSHGVMMDWFYDAETLYCRLANLNAAAGDTEYEMGQAYLTNLTNQRQKGQKVSASIQIEFDGVPTRTAKAALS